MANIKLFNSLTKTTEPFQTDGNIIKWYSCGPTVYDTAHLGHARTFLTFDIIRRIFEHYGYQVFYVMNITDIDDKIIERVSKLPDLTQDNYNVKFNEFVRTMEAEFWKDMDQLNIKRPLVITRVTEYIPKMIEYIEELEDTGFAYPSNGSVYFDVQRYIDRGFNNEPLKHLVEDSENPNEGSNKFKEDKRDPRDFALWKAVKPGELFFQSRWGPGRPGWHLECSVMATDILGKSIDIHSGGIDLIHPHHQCEIQQSTAHENDPSYKWINYFMHSGHLNIDGKKMSKSLKNFKSIQHYLEHIGSGQELRVLFLMHRWDKPLDYDLDTINEAKWTNKRIQELVDHLQFIIFKEDKPDTPYNSDDTSFFEMLNGLKIDVNASLQNNFDTMTAMKAILDSVSTVYKYLEGNRNRPFIILYYDYLIMILGIFGLKYVNSDESNLDVDKFVRLGVDLREDVRRVVMENKKTMDKETLQRIFAVLDDFRDNRLKDAGIVLQDRSGGDTTKYISSSSVSN